MWHSKVLAVIVLEHDAWGHRRRRASLLLPAVPRVKHRQELSD